MRTSVGVLIILSTIGLTAACSSDLTDGEADEGALTDSSNDNGSIGQGWSSDVTTHYERTSDGSGVFPYTWLLALEQADSEEMFLSDANLRHYGMIPSAKSAANPDGLPVGLAKQPNGDQIGTTCSSCHEAEITYQGKTMRIHGGQGKGQVMAFFKDAYGVLAKQLLNPAKFNRFANRVLNDSDPKKIALFLDTVKTTIQAGLKVVTEKVVDSDVPALEAGPFRTDAVGLGVNNLVGPIKASNLRQTNAPVSMPPMWDTPRFDWVEYNGAFRQPMTRNVISALARGAKIQFVSDGKPGLPNNVEVGNLFDIEENLRQLKSPKWPEDILGAIDADKAAQGKAVYDRVGCDNCHGAPVGSDGALQIKMIPLEVIGTDTNQALNWANRQVDMNGALGMGVISGTDFAKLATQGVIDRDYYTLGIPAEKQNEMNGYRSNDWRGVKAYRARPLDGVWATGPYLHNGSVVNLYEMLLPQDKRSKSFNIGSQELDPKAVGLVPQGEFVFDTSLDGNHNYGHSGTQFGTDLPDADRWALIEYLKTL